jgi:hypothetical protein
MKRLAAMRPPRLRPRRARCRSPRCSSGTAPTTTPCRAPRRWPSSRPWWYRADWTGSPRAGRALHGRLPAAAAAAGKVYLELPAPGGPEADAFDVPAPKGAGAVLYLAPAPTRANMPIVDEAAGRPAGQPLFQPANPQGFVIEDAGDVLQVIEHIQFRGAKLADFTPSASRFPLDRATHLD